MRKEAKYRTIVVSDIHLGSKFSKVDEVIDFLEHNSCETLILNGDIIDGWAILRGNRDKWLQKHSDFARLIIKLQENTRIVYLRGNHDDFLSRLLPLTMANISLVNDMVYESKGKKYYIFHGDIFDNVTTGFKWAAKLGDIGYNILLSINKVYNQWRARRGLAYHSISQGIKHLVKRTVSKHSKFEQQVVAAARKKHCDGAICGHIHRPEISLIDDILYLNSGDWVESLSALVEDFSGQWKLYFHPQH